MRAGPQQAAVLAALHEAACGEAAWPAAAFAKLLVLPGHAGFLDPRGGLVLVRFTGEEAEILTLAVHPQMRRQGIGWALLAAAIAWAAATGASALFLEVAETNATARALYAAAGFVEIGRRQRYYATAADALVMRLSLGANAARG